MKERRAAGGCRLFESLSDTAHCTEGVLKDRKLDVSFIGLLTGFIYLKKSKKKIIADEKTDKVSLQLSFDVL